MIGIEGIRACICQLSAPSREASWQSKGLVDTSFWHSFMQMCL